MFETGKAGLTGTTGGGVAGTVAVTESVLVVSGGLRPILNTVEVDVS
jgi:hypothetical protein